MTATGEERELFPTIGKVADQTDRIQENPDSVVVNDQDERAVTEVESLCMKCDQQGTTRLLLTSIPFFRDIVLMSFRCEYCGAQNNEIQSAAEIQEEGVTYTVRILNRSDLDRQIVRSATCEISIPEMELTLPPTSRGQVTTVEGLIRDIVSDLSLDQPLRRIHDPDHFQKIQKIVDQFMEIIGDEDENEQPETLSAFTVNLDDPAGNSFFQFVGSPSDPGWTMKTYRRTLEQNVALGLVDSENSKVQDNPKVANPEAILDDNSGVGEDEIFVFPGTCSSCGHSIETNMKKINIPYFKDVLIMSTNCDKCGYRDNEIKSGGAISDKGKRITLKVEGQEDLSRDLLKSETAGLTVPEIDLVLTHGTLGGRFTTLEGILQQVHDELTEKIFMSGDSSKAEDRASFDAFLKNLRQVIKAERPFTMILNDPLANSYIQNLYAPDPDPNMTIEYYERSWEENEELGLNDIKVEGYEVEDIAAKDSKSIVQVDSNSVS